MTVPHHDFLVLAEHRYRIERATASIRHRPSPMPRRSPRLVQLRRAIRRVAVRSDRIRRIPPDRQPVVATPAISGWEGSE